MAGQQSPPERESSMNTSASIASKRCKAPDDSRGVVCTLWRGHPGDHEAVFHDRPVWSWKQAPALTPLDWLDAIDRHLDREVGQLYHDQPLAQDWARTAKVAEEAGEAIAELILWTQQNPRKVQRGDKGSKEALLAELADVVITGALAIQHFTKDAVETRALLRDRLEATHERIAAYDAARVRS
jgi:hypothetical protein